MPTISRRTLLGWAAVAPVLPNLLIERAWAENATAAADRYDGRVVIVVRMMGGNDGLNSVIPVRNDLYYRARPNIAIAREQTIALAGQDAGLHASLQEFHRLMESGDAGIVLGVGYPGASRSHLRSTEIWETASLATQAPAAGWLGRYLDSSCDCTHQSNAGVAFGNLPNRLLAAASNTHRLIGHPDLLMNVDAAAMQTTAQHGPATIQFAGLSQAQTALADSARLVQRASKGHGRHHDYPDTAFGNALRWAGDMIETECPVRAYTLNIGSFDNDAPSFDTHSDQLAKHRQLYAELGAGLRALASHMRIAKQFERVLLLTYSDFGRQLPENRTFGTEHGEAGVLFYAGGAVRAGLQGEMPDLADLADNALKYRVDFRGVYADVLQNWLQVRAAPLLDEGIEPFPIVRGG